MGGFIVERIGSWPLFRDSTEECSRIGEAVFGIADEGLVDGGGDFLGEAGQAVADRDGVFVEDDVDGVALGIEAVREFSGEQVVESGGEAPDVGDGFWNIQVGAVHAAEVAQGDLGRAGFEQEMVAGDLSVVRQAEVAVLHAAEQKGIVLGEFEGAGGTVGVLDLEVDGGGHGYWLEVICYWEELKQTCGRDAHTP